MTTQQSACFSRQLKDFEFKCLLNKESLIINGKLKSQKLIFGASLKPSKMPPSCTNIFDLPSQLFFYLQKQKYQGIFIEQNVMKVNVHLEHLGRSKVVEIPLQTKSFGKEEMLEMDVESMKERIQRLEKIVQKLAPAQLSKLHDYNIVQKIDDHEWRLKKIEDKSAHLTSMQIEQAENIRQHEVHKKIQQPIKQPPINKKPQITASDPLAKLNMIKKRQQNEVHPFSLPLNREDSKEKEGLVTKEKEFVNPQEKEGLSLKQKGSLPLGLQLFLRTFKFEIDISNKNLDNNYIVKKDLVTKKSEDQRLYQIYSANHIPDRNRYRVTFKFNVHSPEEVSFGLITEDKKHLQFIYEQPETISMGCDEGYQFYIDGRPQNQFYLQKIKYGYVMQMDVQLKSRKVSFFRQGDHHNPVAEALLPESMCNKKLYVYFQIKNQGDSVQLLQG